MATCVGLAVRLRAAWGSRWPQRPTVVDSVEWRSFLETTGSGIRELIMTVAAAYRRSWTPIQSQLVLTGVTLQRTSSVFADKEMLVQSRRTG
jgi:hypothetical protein